VRCDEDDRELCFAGLKLFEPKILRSVFDHCKSVIIGGGQALRKPTLKHILNARGLVLKSGNE